MKRLVAKITVKPNDSKNDDFTLALVDYFNQEFKNNNLNSKRNNSYVKVALNGKYMDKYDSVIIDCCNGKVYLRGDNVKDKYFGRLSKFNLKRKSDAYHCVNYNANRLIHRITKINNSFQQIELQAKKVSPIIKDLRLNIVDLRNNNKKTALMSLDEAIEHADEVAYNNLYSLTGCDACGEEHLQLAHWLRELKKYKEEYPMLDMRDEPRDENFPLVYAYGSKKVLDLRRTAEKEIDFDEEFDKILNSDEMQTIFKNADLHDVTREYEKLPKIINKDNKYTPEEMVQWDGYLNLNATIWKFRDAYCKVKNAEANDLATELDNNDDAVGRRIPVKNINHINDFNRDKPFIYYEGKIYFGKDSNATHRDLVNMITGDDSNKSRSRRSVQNQINDEKVGFGHVVGDIAFVDDDTFNCSQEEVAKALKNESNINKVYTNPYYGESYFVRLANKFHLVKDLRKVCIDLRNKVKNIVKNNIIDMRKNIIDVR